MVLLNPFRNISKRLFKEVFAPKNKISIPLNFSEERYATAYPDCKGKAQKHYIKKGFYQKRICYTTEDMGDKKETPTHDSPLISIVVTCYNYEQYIGETLDSLINQTYKNIEVIVVDDGSSDSSVDIVKSYVDKYDFIHLYLHPDKGNHGLTASMRLGIDKSNGEYVAFCESDDCLRPNNIQEKVKLINNYENVVIISNAIEMFGDAQSILARDWICSHIKKLLKQGGTKIDVRFNQSLNFIPTLSSVMIRTDILKRLDYNTPIPAWIDFWLYRQILSKHILYFVDKDLTLWRQHNDSFNGMVNASQNSRKSRDFIRQSNKLIGI